MDEKERYKSHVLFGNVSGYDQEMKYIAHWLWWDNGVCHTVPIADERDGVGLEKSAAKHPDQAFWTGKLKVSGRPHRTAIIVTDCKLLPCDKDKGCASRVPYLVGEKLGKGIPIGVFCHNDYVAKGGSGKFGYYTESGDSQDEIMQAKANVFRWDWDAESDGATY